MDKPGERMAFIPKRDPESGAEHGTERDGGQKRPSQRRPPVQVGMTTERQNQRPYQGDSDQDRGRHSGPKRTHALAIVLLFALLWPLSAQAQNGTLIPFVPQYFEDTNGNPCSGCKLYAYAAGTSTPQATYSDVSLATPNANPVIISASGFPSTGYIYLSATSYKFTLTTSADVEIWTRDNISAVPTTQTALDVTGTAGEALAAGEAVYLSDGSGALTAGRWYKADADNTYSSSAAGMVGIAPSAIASGASGSIRISGRVTGLSSLAAGEQYYVSATAGGLTGTPPTNQRWFGEAESTTVLVLQGNPGGVRLPDSDGTHALVIKTTSDLTADRLLTLVPGDAARTLTISGDSTIDQNVATTGSPTFADITFSGGDLIASANAVIRRNTSDGSDSGTMTVTGAGAAGSTRGVDVVYHGNEHATNPGDVLFTLGDVAGAQFRVSNGTDALTIEESNGSALFTSSVTAAAFNINSTATDGPTVTIERSGSDVGYLGSNAGLGLGGANTDFAFYAPASLYVEATTEIRSVTIYNDTAADAANVYVQSDGTLGRSTSSARYKQNIARLTDWRFLLDLEPVTFESRGRTDGRRYGGFLAEGVASVAPMFVGYNDAGDPDEVAYGHLTAPIVAAIKDLEARLTALEAENAELRARLGLTLNPTR